MCIGFILLVIVRATTIMGQEVIANHRDASTGTRQTCTYFVSLTCVGLTAPLHYGSVCSVAVSCIIELWQIICSLLARLNITVTISQDYGWYGVDVTIDAGVLNSFVNVQPRTNLCSLETMTYLPSSSDETDGVSNSIYCPTPGNYQLYWSFTVPKGGGDAQLQYTPDFRIKFYSTMTDTTLGCAGTGTKATVQQAEQHKKEGEIALGVALTTLFAIFAVCLCMAYRRKKQLESEEDDLWQRKRFYMARSPVPGTALPIDGDGHYSCDGIRDPYMLQQRQTSEDQDEYVCGQQGPPPEQYAHLGEGYSQHRADGSITSSLPYSVDPSSLESSLPSRFWIPSQASDVPTTIDRY
jgi:hypothetical protein